MKHRLWYLCFGLRRANCRPSMCLIDWRMTYTALSLIPLCHASLVNTIPLHLVQGSHYQIHDKILDNTMATIYFTSCHGIVTNISWQSFPTTRENTTIYVCHKPKTWSPEPQISHTSLYHGPWWVLPQGKAFFNLWKGAAGSDTSSYVVHMISLIPFSFTSTSNPNYTKKNNGGGYADYTSVIKNNP